MGVSTAVSLVEIHVGSLHSPARAVIRILIMQTDALDKPAAALTDPSPGSFAGNVLLKIYVVIDVFAHCHGVKFPPPQEQIPRA